MPGFRKGKVPAKMVEEKLENQDYEESVSKILSPAYSHELKNRTFIPSLFMFMRNLWRRGKTGIEIETAEVPTVTLVTIRTLQVCKASKPSYSLERAQKMPIQKEKIKVVFRFTETTKLKIPELHQV